MTLISLDQLEREFGASPPKSDEQARLQFEVIADGIESGLIMAIEPKYQQTVRLTLFAAKAYAPGAIGMPHVTPAADAVADPRQVMIWQTFCQDYSNASPVVAVDELSAVLGAQ